MLRVWIWPSCSVNEIEAQFLVIAYLPQEDRMVWAPRTPINVSVRDRYDVGAKRLILPDGKAVLKKKPAEITQGRRIADADEIN